MALPHPDVTHTATTTDPGTGAAVTVAESIGTLTAGQRLIVVTGSYQGSVLHAADGRDCATPTQSAGTATLGGWTHDVSGLVSGDTVNSTFFTSVWSAPVTGSGTCTLSVTLSSATGNINDNGLGWSAGAFPSITSSGTPVDVKSAGTVVHYQDAGSNTISTATTAATASSGELVLAFGGDWGSGIAWDISSAGQTLGTNGFGLEAGMNGQNASGIGPFIVTASKLSGSGTSEGGLWATPSMPTHNILAAVTVVYQVASSTNAIITPTTISATTTIASSPTITGNPVLSHTSVSVNLSGIWLWQCISPPTVHTDDFLHNGDNFGYNAILVDPRDQSVIVTTCYQGLWRTTDQGNTWTKWNTGTGSTLIDGGKCWTLARDPFNLNTLWSASYAGGGGPLKSTDNGVSWAQDFPSDSRILYNTPYVICCDPYLANHVIATYHDPWTTNNIDSGIIESFDAGTTWALRNPGSWGTGNVICFLNNSSTWLLGCQSGGIFKTTNSGGSWTQVSANAITHGALYFAQYSPLDGAWYVCMNNSGIFRSTDNCSTFTSLGMAGNYFQTCVSDGQFIYTLPAFPTQGTFSAVPTSYLVPGPNAAFANYGTQILYAPGNIASYPGICNGPVCSAYDSVHQTVYTTNWNSGVWKLVRH